MYRAIAVAVVIAMEEALRLMAVEGMSVASRSSTTSCGGTGCDSM
jgi:hypothetical protein